MSIPMIVRYKCLNSHFHQFKLASWHCRIMWDQYEHTYDSEIQMPQLAFSPVQARKLALRDNVGSI